MRILLATTFAAVLATSAQAAVYDITLTQDGIGDSGPDWFGTVETNMSGTVTSASFLVNAVSYDTIASSGDPFPTVVFESVGATTLAGVVAPEPISSSSQTVLHFFNFVSDGVLNRNWGFSPCDNSLCGGGAFAGTYTINEATTPVIPLPAAGWLLLAGLGGLAALRRRPGAALA